ncbi:MAG TPA: LexA family transcriptional regulator [Thermotogota bacterium]|nr:LexA family transcriptional regulator [Thermotogota bacterium]HRW92808.1 LexA family transcriptional regulator [Thermotogota bacterium]
MLHKEEGKETIGMRLRRARESKGLPRHVIADAAGISTNGLYMYESERRGPSAVLLQRLADALGVSIAYLAGETDLMNPPPKVTSNLKMFEENLATLPVYSSVSAGYGSIPLEEPIDFIPRPPDISGDMWVVVRGDSMSPKINDGDLVLVSREAHIGEKDIVVVIMEGEALVKCIEMHGESKVLTSINPEYPPIYDHGTTFFLVGKVTHMLKNI